MTEGKDKRTPPTWIDIADTDCPSCEGQRCVRYKFKPRTSHKHIAAYAAAGKLKQKAATVELVCPSCGYTETSDT